MKHGSGWREVMEVWDRVMPPTNREHAVTFAERVALAREGFLMGEPVSSTWPPRDDEPSVLTALARQGNGPTPRPLEVSAAARERETEKQNVSDDDDVCTGVLGVEKIG